MHKLLIAAAVAVGLAAADARADWGTPPRPAPDAGCAGGNCSGCQFGLNPVLKKLLWWKKDAGCGTAGCGGRNCAGTAAAAPPPFMGGTLVYPNHPFARSPRDYFMYGQGGN